MAENYLSGATNIVKDSDKRLHIVAMEYHLMEQVYRVFVMTLLEKV